MSKTQRGYLYMLLSAATFASISVFMKRAYGAGMSPWSFSVVQSGFAMIQLLLLKWREAPPATPRPKVGSLKFGWLLLLIFALSGAGAGLAFNVALVHLSISLGTILLFTYPAFVALGAWAFLGDRPSLRHWLALGLTLVGAILTLDVGGALAGLVSLLGIGLALLSALCQGAYIVLGDRLGPSLSPITATIITRGAIMLGAILLHPPVLGELLSLTPEALLVTLGASLVGGVMPFLFLYKGIALIGANRAAIVSVVELPFALVLGRLFEGDQILLLQLLGALLIGFAVILSQGGAGAAAEGEALPGPEPITGLEE